MMNSWKFATTLSALLALSACTSDKVIFVTSSSFGINLDTTPSSVSIAYDRTEGYAAPSYKSGTLPPVMASIETDGTAIAPKIRQVYATGAAAVIAAGGRGAEPSGMTHRTGRLAFVGTTTTLGLKAAFTAAVPESLSLGFKRKEFSYIPLGCQNATAAACAEDDQDLYPSVIASYDTTISVPSGPGTVFKTRQYVATGLAAEALAKVPEIAASFVNLGSTAVADATGQQQAVEHQVRVADLGTHLTKAGSFDQVELSRLVDLANTRRPNSVPQYLKQAPTVDRLRSSLRGNPTAAASLLEVVRNP